MISAEDDAENIVLWAVVFAGLRKRTRAERAVDVRGTEGSFSMTYRL